MTVVDVNTGKYTGAGGNLEETVTRNNLEAAEEIVRQLRLRDIGGIVVIDFIDMVLESNRELVLRRLTECLGRDRTKHQVTEITSLGLVQMTRKRIGAGPARGVQRDLRPLQGPRRDHPHRAGAGEAGPAARRNQVKAVASAAAADRAAAAGSAPARRRPAAARGRSAAASAVAAPSRGRRSRTPVAAGRAAARPSRPRSAGPATPIAVARPTRRSRSAPAT